MRKRGMSLQAVGDIYGISRERVRQIVSGLSRGQSTKENARKRLQYAVKIGKVTKKPCEVCGSAASEAHHQDYSKPLDVVWLCRKHHRGQHRSGEAIKVPPFVKKMNRPALHGSSAKYNSGCRCDTCKQANKNRIYEYRKQKREGK